MRRCGGVWVPCGTPISARQKIDDAHSEDAGDAFQVGQGDLGPAVESLAHPRVVHVEAACELGPADGVAPEMGADLTCYAGR
jgi:hypothetical protein